MASRPRVRVGIVGAGFVAHIHGEAYRHVRGVDVELACVTAARPERAQAYAREFGVARVVADLHAVLADPDVDLVDLCVPAHLHAAMAIEAARAGKHVIVEKPLTGFFGPPTTPREEMLTRALASADQVLAAAASAGVRLCYAENWVYAPPIQMAPRLFTASGGPMLRLVGEESHSGTHAPINKRWVTGGGGSLIGKACHPLGAALYLKADEGRRLRGAPVRPVSVMAETAQLADTATFRAATPRYLNIVEGADVEDWGTMLITFDDGTVAAISAADTARRRWCSATSTPTISCRPTRPRRPCSATSTSWRRSRPRRAGPRLSPTRSGPPATRRRCRTSWSAWPPAASRSRAARSPATSPRSSTAPTSPRTKAAASTSAPSSPARVSRARCAPRARGRCAGPRGPARPPAAAA